MRTRALLVVVGVSYLLVASGCADDRAGEIVCDTGISCPRDARCAARQAICIHSDC